MPPQPWHQEELIRKMSSVNGLKLSGRIMLRKTKTSLQSKILVANFWAWANRWSNQELNLKMWMSLLLLMSLKSQQSKIWTDFLPWANPWNQDLTLNWLKLLRKCKERERHRKHVIRSSNQLKRPITKININCPTLNGTHHHHQRHNSELLGLSNYNYYSSIHY